MSIKQIVATFECDSCGVEIAVDLDPSYVPPIKWCLMDYAEDLLGGSFDDASAVDGIHLCSKCTKEADDL